jgi:biofilm PGA synthesis N-glycosyltransferase PgaC
MDINLIMQLVIGFVNGHSRAVRVGQAKLCMLLRKAQIRMNRALPCPPVHGSRTGPGRCFFPMSVPDADSFVYLQNIMNQALQIAFWVLLALVCYTYLGYGMLLYLILRLRKKKRRREFSGEKPSLAFIIPAYNEEDFIARKIANTLSLDYPRDRLRVILVADGSNDATASIAAGTEGIFISDDVERKGKAAALNRGVALSGDVDILVFSDANTLVNRDALNLLVRHYADPEVGAVSGEKKVMSGGTGLVQAEGESIYWWYESLLKKLDSDFHTVVGAAGELLSMRRELFSPLPEHIILDDFYLSLKVCTSGKVVRYEPAAVALESPSLTIGDERKRKTRISAGAFQAMSLFSGLLIPYPYPLLSFQYVSHRVMRWVVCPLALPLLLMVNILICAAPGPIPGIYFAAGWAQALFCGMALTGWAMAGLKLPRLKFFYIPYYFFFMNYSVWTGFFKYINNSQSVRWEKAGRLDSNYNRS